MGNSAGIIAIVDNGNKGVSIIVIIDNGNNAIIIIDNGVIIAIIGDGNRKALV